MFCFSNFTTPRSAEIRNEAIAIYEKLLLRQCDVKTLVSFLIYQVFIQEATAYH